jgi:hypothetical protein
MATGIVNPYALATPNTRYRDAVLADNPMSLWMLDEPYGNDVAVDQGNSPSNGTYTGALSTSSTQRGSRTIFGLDAIGNATTGVKGGYVHCPLNNNNQSKLGRGYSYFDVSFEFLLHVDGLGHENYLLYGWSPWYILFRNTNRFEGRFQSRTAQTDYARSAYSAIAAGTDYHCVLMVSGTNSNRTWYWYVNGVLSSTNYYAGAWAGMSVQSYLKAGGWTTSAGSTGIYGGMAGIAIYDYSIGSTKALAHYNALL